MGPMEYPWFFTSQRLSFICFSRMCISRGVSEADLPWWFHVDGIFNSIQRLDDGRCRFFPTVFVGYYYNSSTRVFIVYSIYR